MDQVQHNVGAPHLYDWGDAVPVQRRVHSMSSNSDRLMGMGMVLIVVPRSQWIMVERMDDFQQTRQQ